MGSLPQVSHAQATRRPRGRPFSQHIPRFEETPEEMARAMFAAAKSPRPAKPRKIDNGPKGL